MIIFSISDLLLAQACVPVQYHSLRSARLDRLFIPISLFKIFLANFWFIMATTTRNKARSQKTSINEDIPAAVTQSPLDILTNCQIAPDNPLAPVVTALMALILDQQKVLISLTAKIDSLIKPNSATNSLTVEEIERRRSAVVAGVPERGGATSYARWKEDNEGVIRMLEKTDVECGAKVYRLGQFTPGKHRPLKVIFPASSFQRTFISNFRAMRENNPQYKDVFARPSLTAEQRKKDYELRQECRQLRDAGQKVRIFKGKIIPQNHGFQSGNH